MLMHAFKELGELQRLCFKLTFQSTQCEFEKSNRLRIVIFWFFQLVINLRCIALIGNLHAVLVFEPAISQTSPVHLQLYIGLFSPFIEQET